MIEKYRNTGIRIKGNLVCYKILDIVLVGITNCISPESRIAERRQIYDNQMYTFILKAELESVA